MLSLIVDSDVNSLNCSSGDIVVRFNYRGVDSEPMLPSALNLAYNDTCQPEAPLLSPLGTIINLKMAPAIMVLTLCTNILICIVLTRKNMISSTNIILLGMAIADMLTGVCPLPVFIASYFTGVPQQPAVAYMFEFFAQYMPTCWHAASVWLTVLLAVQRFVFITFPAHARTLCTVRHSVISTIVIFIFFFVFNAILISLDYMIITVGCSRSTTTITKIEWGDGRLYRCFWSAVSRAVNFYVFGRLVLMHILPCVTLTIFTSLLILGMHTAVRNRRRLLNSSSTARGERDNHSKEANATSRMLIVVLIIFLIVEVPNGIATTLFVVFRLVPSQLIEALNFAIVVSYPVNFFVYCGMSRQFRGTFRKLLGLPEIARTRPPATEIVPTKNIHNTVDGDDKCINRPESSRTDADLSVTPNNGTVGDRTKLYIPLTTNQDEGENGNAKPLPISQTLPQETYDEDDDDTKDGVIVMSSDIRQVRDERTPLAPGVIETAVDLDTDIHTSLMTDQST